MLIALAKKKPENNIYRNRRERTNKKDISGEKKHISRNINVKIFFSHLRQNKLLRIAFSWLALAK